MRFRELERVAYSWVDHLGRFFVEKYGGPGVEASSMEELATCVKHYRVVEGDNLLWRKALEGEQVVWGYMRYDKGNQFYPVEDIGVLVYVPKKPAS